MIKVMCHVDHCVMAMSHQPLWAIHAHSAYNCAYINLKMQNIKALKWEDNMVYIIILRKSPKK